MEKLYQYSSLQINAINTTFKRYLWNHINWDNRLIFITGARGVGKTTFLLQYIKENLMDKPDEVIYVSLDDLYFSRKNIVDFAEDFVKRGGKYLFIDEIHKYKNWSQEIKNIYDYFNELQIVVTGSSALNIFKGKADLSRRAISYKMKGLSFREYIEFKHNHHFRPIALEEILFNAPTHISNIQDQIKPIKLFEDYIKTGYYPFFIEGETDFYQRLKQTVNHILENDLPSIERIDFIAVQNLKKLLSIITEIAPFKPNILKLSKQIGVSRETLQKYLYLLSMADLLLLLQSNTHGISKLNKPEKVYLNNPNLIHALSDKNINTGNLRETFFYNQLNDKYNIKNTKKGDFWVDQKYTLEIGGKNKTKEQISGLENAFLALDNIEFAHQNTIPLWLFGFLY